MIIPLSWGKRACYCQKLRSVSPQHSIVKLLTHGCGRKYSIYCRVPSKNRQLGANVLNSLMAFREGFLKETFGVKVAEGMTFF